MNFDLVVTDMDGTLLDENHNIPNEFWPLLNRMHNHGITFAPASGRQLHTLQQQFAQAGHDISIIAENGTVIYHQGDIIDTTPLNPTDVHHILNHTNFTAPDTGIVLCRPDGAYITNTNPHFLSQCQPYYKKLTTVTDLTPLVDNNIIKIAIYSRDEAETTTAPQIQPHTGNASLVISGYNWIDIMNPQANKGNALHTLTQKLGIDPQRTLVFGDYLNDLELIQQAGTSYAMENAHPDIKKAADHIAPPNTQHGVIQVLNQLLP